MRNQKGITLIALVVIIIVLLILAGISIAMLMGENGILTQASKAKKNTLAGEVKERIDIALNDIYTEIYAQKAEDDTWVATETPTGGDEGPKAEIKNILTKNNIKITGGAGDYIWKYDSNFITISYVNPAADIDTAISGKINIKETPYTITRAE